MELTEYEERRPRLAPLGQRKRLRVSRRPDRFPGHRNHQICKYHQTCGSHRRRGDGGLAQLVEHLLCKQGVNGSSPLSSTILRSLTCWEREE